MQQDKRSRLPARRLPRPQRRVRLPHPVHRDQRRDHRMGRRRDLPGGGRGDLLESHPFYTGKARTVDSKGVSPAPSGVTGRGEGQGADGTG